MYNFDNILCVILLVFMILVVLHLLFKNKNFNFKKENFYNSTYCTTCAPCEDIEENKMLCEKKITRRIYKNIQEAKDNNCYDWKCYENCYKEDCVKKEDKKPDIDKGDSNGRMCCQAMTPTCQACKAGISVEEYLKGQKEKMRCRDHIDRLEYCKKTSSDLEKKYKDNIDRLEYCKKTSSDLEKKYKDNIDRLEYCKKTSSDLEKKYIDNIDRLEYCKKTSSDLEKKCKYDNSRSNTRHWKKNGLGWFFFLKS